jgi:hypothetical protein
LPFDHPRNILARLTIDAIHSPDSSFRILVRARRNESRTFRIVLWAVTIDTAPARPRPYSLKSPPGGAALQSRTIASWESPLKSKLSAVPMNSGSKRESRKEGTRSSIIKPKEICRVPKSVASPRRGIPTTFEGLSIPHGRTGATSPLCAARSCHPAAEKFTPVKDCRHIK